MRKFAKSIQKLLFITIPVVILTGSIIYALNVLSSGIVLWNSSTMSTSGTVTGAFQQLTGLTPQMPPEAREQVSQRGYTILSSEQSSAPQNLRWGLGLTNRDYEEVWCVTAQGASGMNGILAVRKGQLWQVVYPEFVPPGNASDVFLSLNCRFEQGR